MNLGKSLRLRRIFSSGRALIVDLHALSADPIAQVRRLARGPVDAFVLTPGLLEIVAEEIGSVAVVLETGSAAEAVEMGADAMFAGAIQVDAVRTEARRLGMPVFAYKNAADLSADVLCVDPTDTAAFEAGRLLRKPVVVRFGPADAERVVLDAHAVLQSPVEGILLDAQAAEPAALDALHALVHQGVSAAEALALAERAPARGNRI